MKLAKGPRPRTIRAFAILGLIAALVGFYESLNDFGFLLGDGSWHVPTDEGERVRAVSLTSARLCIALIPLGLVWFFASNVARWLILVFGALKVWGVLSNANGSFQSPAIWLDPTGVVVAGIGVFAAALLFSPTANRWFEPGKQRVETVFD